MNIRPLFLFIAVFLLLISGCARMMNLNYESPVVSLRSFRLLPGKSITPGFEIVLDIINPNRDALELEGIYYTIAVEGYEVLAGVSGDLPVVEPYGREEIVLIATIDIVKGINFVHSLIAEPRDSFEFRFSAKLDPGGLNPRILVEEKGRFSLQGK